MDRIATAFAKTASEGRPCFVSYICGGDPNLDASFEVCRTLVEEGADLLEIGMPFSDPVADGVTNQLASQRALDAGIRPQDIFELTRRLRDITEAPIIYYAYYNLIFANGIERFVTAAKEAGVDGILTLDLPPEEAGDLQEACGKAGLANIFIIAPTTPPERMKKIAAAASGFIYYVSREGVTGERSNLSDNIAQSVAEIKKHTDLPVVVGFGISNADHVRQLTAGKVDGVVVGSALVNCIAADPDDTAGIRERLQAKMRDLVTGFKD